MNGEWFRLLCTTTTVCELDSLLGRTNNHLIDCRYSKSYAYILSKKKEKKNKNLLLESYYKLLFGRILLATVGFEKRLLLRKKYFIITMLTYYYIWLDRATTMILSRRTPNDNYLSTTYTTTYLQHGTKNGFLSLILIHYHHCYWYQ